jgi:very-short-patch-repair endonuclease
MVVRRSIDWCFFVGLLRFSLSQFRIRLLNDAVSDFTTCHKQYCVNGYRVDLYLKDINLVIECDEMGHEYKNVESEQLRQKNIETTLGCEFIRFNPDIPGFRLGKVLNTIFKKIVEFPV